MELLRLALQPCSTFSFFFVSTQSSHISQTIRWSRLMMANLGTIFFCVKKNEGSTGQHGIVKIHAVGQIHTGVLSLPFIPSTPMTVYNEYFAASLKTTKGLQTHHFSYFSCLLKKKNHHHSDIVNRWLFLR